MITVKMSNEEKLFFEHIYAEASQVLMHYALAVFMDWEQVEDAVQEVFSVACAKANVLIACPNYKGWLVNTMKYIIRDHWREKSKYNGAVLRLAEQELAKEMTTELFPSLELVLKDTRLSKDYSLIKRYYLEGRTIKELAREKGITVEACKKRVQRAKSRLKNYIEKYDFYC